MDKEVIAFDGRLFFVGDLHGEITKLNNMLVSVGFDKNNDLLISVGDLIDRGEDSLACLNLITEPWFKAVRGNHEQMAIDALRSNKDDLVSHWLANGGDWFIKLETTEQRNEARSLIRQASLLPHVIEINHCGKKIVVCHADWGSDEYGDNYHMPELNLLWSRERYYDYQRGVSRVIKGADLFIFGHTPVRRVTRVQNQAYIDTGAVFGKELTVISAVALLRAVEVVS
ncbi:metallophosphoesterase [Photobacterium toruni]|uniref:metallophosphoesterase n=1 Tax=Photobacterium toruni TaxID=1935446 RepID=UPI00210FB2DA|nr:metallophosphoesterase [Photobacterium toruni]